MTREAAIAQAHAHFDSGAFRETLARRVAIPTESQNSERAADLARYLDEDMRPAFAALGLRCEMLRHEAARAPFMIAERIEDPSLPTVLIYGHGDVVRGQEDAWREGLSPWTLVAGNDRWYGRGTADNKGQHSINLAAMGAVLAARGRLGFNVKWLMEMGEETGSPGLRAFCERHRARLTADVLIASDGPRLQEDRPTIFLGSRGAFPIDFTIQAREAAHHSGNWGGLLASPAIQLVHALATIAGPSGQIRIPEWTPADIPDSVRRALADCDVSPGPGEPEIDPGWGEPGLSAAERLFAWCAFEILAMSAGNPAQPVNAIPARAWARGQLRYVVGVDPQLILSALRRHLDRHGFGFVKVESPVAEASPATRLDPDHPWVRFVARSIEASTGLAPHVLPNIGGTLPNDVFADTLGLPTIWIPHSYRGCAQHAPNEHLPVALARQALGLMAGLYWDLGEGGAPERAA
jgi:acetylornithine deacetylase/succinyl-diaminopimelate desuccinylase-like protein